MASSSLHAVDPHLGLRKTSFRHGDLSGIRPPSPDSPAWILPSPREGQTLSASPVEYANATDPRSPQKHDNTSQTTQLRVQNPSPEEPATTQAENVKTPQISPRVRNRQPTRCGSC